MTIARIRYPFEPIIGLNAQGLTGHLYIGLENLDPIDDTKAAYWDAAGTQPAEQPIDVQGGYAMRDGTAAQIFTDGRYSIRAETMGGALVWEKSSDGPDDTAAGEGAYEAGFTTMAAMVDGDWFAWNFVGPRHFPANFAGSSGRGRPTVTTTCTIKLNCTIGADETLTGGSSVGTIVYHTDGSVPTFTTAGGTAKEVVAGDAYFFIFTAANGLAHASATLAGAVVS